MKKESIKDGKLQEAIKLADGFVDLINKSSHSGSYEIVGTALIRPLSYMIAGMLSFTKKEQLELERKELINEVIQLLDVHIDMWLDAHKKYKDTPF